MKKILSVIIAMLTIVSMFTLVVSASFTPEIIVSGYEVSGDIDGINVYYIDASGNVVAPKEAVKVLIKGTGDIILNNEVITAGKNGKVNVSMALPVEYEVAPVTLEPTEVEGNVIAKSNSEQHTPPKMVIDDATVTVIEDEVGAPFLAELDNSGNFFTALWARIMDFFRSVFTLFGGRV